MKYLKFISVAVVLCLAFCLCSCGNDTMADPTEAPSEAVTDRPTEAPTEGPTAVPEGYITYTVKVQDSEGKGISGLVLQVCNDDVCMLYEADESGVASFTVEEDEYSVKLIKKPDGYVVESEYLFEEDATELVIVLEKAE